MAHSPHPSNRLSTILSLSIAAVLFLSLLGCAPVVRQDHRPDTPSLREDAVTFPTQSLDLPDGSLVQLTAGQALHRSQGESLRMYSFNHQIPGPLLRVRQGSSIKVNLTNDLDEPTTIHWHGVRLLNAFDGSPLQPIPPHESFVYQITFPDDGIYWYHSHVREDKQVELGLYGNILVAPREPSYYNIVDNEEAIILDDIKISAGAVEPFYQEKVNHALMGRFGDRYIINGKESYRLRIPAGTITRFYLTDAANTRALNISIEGHPLKVVGGDSGLYEHETLSENVVLSPGERVIVETFFEKPGTYRLYHTALEKTTPLGVVTVYPRTPADAITTSKRQAGFLSLKDNTHVIASIDPLRPHVGRPVDDQINMTVTMTGNGGGMNPHGAASTPMAGHDMGGMHANPHAVRREGNGKKDEMPAHEGQDEGAKHPASPSSHPGIEWEDDMPMMNLMSTGQNVRWNLIDSAHPTPSLNYTFRVGDVRKIRIFNDPTAMHPMQHPMHLHGQRFLIVEEDGRQNTNLVWKDTVLVKTGSYVDILVPFTNPGDWMFHCHISEHLETGMMGMFNVVS